MSISEGDLQAVDLLTAAEAASLFGVDKATVCRWCRAGRLRAFQVLTGGDWRIHRADVEARLGKAA